MANIPETIVIRQCLQLLDLLKEICDILDYRTPKLTILGTVQLLVTDQDTTYVMDRGNINYSSHYKITSRHSPRQMAVKPHYYGHCTS
jgi:hypothetical protein